MDADRLLSDWADVTGHARRPAQAPTDRGLRPLGPVLRLAGVAVMAVVLVGVVAWVLPRPADRQVGSSDPVDARPRPTIADCPTTRENGTAWPMTGDTRGTYGAGGLIMRVQPDGLLRIGDAQVDADGVLWEKLGVWREASAAGRLALTGRRLDGPSAPMLAQIPDGYGDTGLQIAGVGFPTEGCWEITATAGTARMVVVTRVVHARPGDPTVPPVTLDTCPVTTANGAHTAAWPASVLDHGNDGLFTVLWPDGTVLVQPDQVDADGTLWMKFVFQRESGALAPLTVVGQRLDTADPAAADATMRAVIPDGYGTSGIQATSLGFPTPGCWEVTAMAGPADLSFVIRVIAD